MKIIGWIIAAMMTLNWFISQMTILKQREIIMLQNKTINVLDATADELEKSMLNTMWRTSDCAGVAFSEKSK